MGSKGVNNIFASQVSSSPRKEEANSLYKASDANDTNEFKKVLDYSSRNKKLRGLKISQHAAKRLTERKIDMNSEEFMKVRAGVDKLKTKGGQDSLVITNRGAYIVDVDNETIVTAIDKKDMIDNVFTKIDSTVFIN